jgi:uncharacterized protein
MLEPSAPAPTASKAARLPLVDALRGAAMLGIMLVNFPSMNTRAGDETSHYGGVHGVLDRLVGAVNLVLCNGKFYPIFALLFGWGLAVLWRGRAREGGRPGPFLARRLLVLLGFGALHVLLVWWGDILTVYAVLGLLVLPALRLGPRALLGAALVLLLAVPLLSPLVAALGASDVVLSRGAGLPAPAAELVQAIYAQGTFGEMVRLRLADWLSDFTPFAGERVTLGAVVGYGAYYAQLAGLFLLGAWAARTDLAARLAADRAWTRSLAWKAGLAAAALTAVRVGVPGAPELLAYFQGEALALFYVVAFALAFPALGRAARPLVAVGRMSLTAYLLHTIAASLLLYGTGVGLYGRIGPAALLPVSIACYALVAAGCLAWLRRFRLGPAEWVWRSLHHGRWEALAR